MSKKDEIEKKLPIPQVKKLLESIGEENLDQFQIRTLDYVSKFSRLDADTAEKIVEELVTNFDLDREESIQIVNCMPQSIPELRIFLASGRRIIETSKLETIINFLNKYRKLK